MAENAVIQAIKGKIEALVAERNRLREQAEKLVRQKERLTARNNDLEAQVATLQQRLAILELRDGVTGAVAPGKDAKAARARIGRLMREVDKCIALLNRQV